MIPATALPRAVSFRPATAADRDFLLRVYTATRTDELAAVPWPPAEKEAFLRQQFETQDCAYHEDYPAEAFQIILIGGTPAGRLYLDRTPEELHLIDIALLPEHRGHGLGTALLQAIIAEAQVLARPIRLYVEHFNPALRLYQRLGFTMIEEHGPYWRMAWEPNGSAPPNA